MKFFTVGRRELALVGCLGAAFLLAGVLAPRGIRSISAGAPARRLPIYSVKTEKKEIALTFDAAWGNSDTDRLLEILKKYQAKATFFCTGQWVSRYPEDVRKIHAAGHAVGNHSDRHLHIQKLTAEQLRADTENCNRKIAALTGSKPLLYRGPYGEYSNALLEMTDSLGMYAIQWNVDSRDWQKKKTAQQMAQAVCENSGNGSILLFHNDTPQTPQAVELVLKRLTGDGYRFVTADRLIYRQNFRLDAAGCQHSTALEAASSEPLF